MASPPPIQPRAKNKKVTARTVAAAPAPKAPTGSTKQPLSQVDPKGTGWVFHNSGNTAAQVGSAGSHGWVVTRADSTAKTASVKGYSSDSKVNGDLEANSSKPSMCVAANGQKVAVS